MIIAMDGPAGSGKSTVAARVAEALGLAFLDTGAMYRAVTLAVLRDGIHPADAEACAAVARRLRLDFDESGRVLIDGVPGEPDIRSRTVTLTVSEVSAHAPVRKSVVAKQRDFAARWKGLVAEGRDMTTVVFPEADHKFFLNAQPRERARRRALQEGRPESIDEIQADIERRDTLDTMRACSPLRRAPDAIEVLTDALTEDEVVAQILAGVRGDAPTDRSEGRDR